MLVVSYATRDLAHRCTKLVEAQEWIGPTEAQALVDMIADLQACENAAEAMDFRGAFVEAGNSVRIDFSPSRFARFSPVTGKAPANAEDVPDWQQVRRLRLDEVGEIV